MIFSRFNSVEFSSRWWLLLPLGLFAIFAVASFNHFQVGAYNDDARYVVLARSIAAGSGYRLTNFPSPLAEITFPPGYPLFLSFFERIWPGTFVPFKLSSLISSLLSIWLVWRLSLALCLTKNQGILAAGLYAIHPWVVNSSSLVMTEALYTVVTLAAVLSVWRSEKARKIKLAWVGIAALLGVAAAAIRSVGLTLIVAVVIYFILTKRFRNAVMYAVIAAVFFTPLFLFNATVGGGVTSSGYQGLMANSINLDQLRQTLHSAAEYTGFSLPLLLLPLPRFHEEVPIFLRGMDFISIAVGVALLSLIVMGLFVKTRVRWRLLQLYLVFYAIALLLYRHSDPALTASTRYLVPLLPFILVAAIRGASFVWSRLVGHLRLSRTVQTSTIIGVVAVFVVVYLIRDAQNVLFPVRDRMTDLTLGTEWLAANTDDTAIVATQDPIPTSLYAKRLTVDLNGASSKEFYRDLLSEKVDYILLKPRLLAQRTNELDASGNDVILPAIAACPEAFLPAYRDANVNVSVYRVDEGKLLSCIQQA